MIDQLKEARAAKLVQIRALMARTVKNGCTEAEAREAAAAVDRQLARYEIDLDEVTVKEQEIVRLDVKGAAKHDVIYAAGRIAGFTDCRTWTSANTDIVYFGFQVDTEIAEYLTMIFLRALDRETPNFIAFNPEYASFASGKVRKEFLTSFRIGMASRLGERLAELKSARDFARKSTGSDLVLIKAPLVEEAFDALGIRFGHSRVGGKSVSHTGAYTAGRTAAEGVSISQGIAGRAAQGGRLK
jgi:hypothetical protein